MLRRNKTHRVNVPESRENEFFQILGFVFGRNEILQSLPRIPRALDEFNAFHLSSVRCVRGRQSTVNKDSHHRGSTFLRRLNSIREISEISLNAGATCIAVV